MAADKPAGPVPMIATSKISSIKYPPALPFHCSAIKEYRPLLSLRFRRLLKLNHTAGTEFRIGLCRRYGFLRLFLEPDVQTGHKENQEFPVPFLSLNLKS